MGAADTRTIAQNSNPVAGFVPERSQAMAELFSRAVRADDETSLYRAIATWLPDIFTADRASVSLLATGDDGNPCLQVLALTGSTGAMPMGLRLRLDATASGRAIEQRAVHRWTVGEGIGIHDEAASLAEIGMVGVMNAPLFSGDEPIGTLNIARRELPFEAEDAALFSDIAAMVAINLWRFHALIRTRSQLAQSRRQEKRLELLGRLGRLLSSAGTEPDVFSAMADMLAQTIPSDRISLVLPDLDKGTFVVGSVSDSGGFDRALGVGAEIPIHGSGMEDVLNHETVGVYPDLAGTGRAEHKPLHALGLRSAVSIPVFAVGRIAAVLNCASTEIDAYSHEDVALATAVATVVGETLERIRALEAVAERDRQLATIVDESPLLSMTVDSDNRLVQVSRFGAHQLGHEPSHITDQPLITLYPDDQHQLVEQQLATISALDQGEVTTWEASMVTSSGQRRRVRHTGRRLAADSDAAVLIVCEDVTEMFELTEKLEYEATHDPLTGLLNRREFDRRLTDLAESGGRAAVLYIDVDQFKIVNDTAGHRAGDALLVELADLVRRTVQADDAIGRLGGDEFAVLLPRCRLASAIRVAERLRRSAADVLFTWEGRTFGLSISVGVVTVDDHNNPDEVLGRADAACYKAKREGRNRIAVSTGTESHKPTGRPDGEWGSRLRDAISSGHLRLVAQPIVPVGESDDLVRAEVLIRMEEADGSLTSAGLFIPPAERLGLVTEIDQWVVSQVADLIDGGNIDMDRIDFLSVNLSPRSVESEGFLDHLLQELSRPGVDAGKLLFEITETAALSQFSDAVQFIETVSAVGCRFALDDFGAGFSTFHYLKRLPVDVLKIDGSLIKDLAIDPIDSSIVSSIASVADALGMDTVAEFVEEPDSLKLLQRLGVTFAQGFGVGRPVDPTLCLPFREPPLPVWEPARGQGPGG